MSKNRTEPENERPEGLDEFQKLVKGIFTMPPEEVKEFLDREKREGIPQDPDAEEPNN